MASNPILDDHSPTSTPESDEAVARIRCQVKLDSYLTRYETAGVNLAKLIADQAWSASPDLCQVGIDALDRYRDRLLFFALAEQRKVAEFPGDHGPDAIVSVQRALDRDSANARKFVGATS